MATITKYDGAPGTGKTWKLTNDFKDALSAGVPPENILFTQFRKEAASDAKQIVSAASGIPENRLPNVRTFHGEFLCLCVPE